MRWELSWDWMEESENMIIESFHFVSFTKLNNITGRCAYSQKHVPTLTLRALSQSESFLCCVTADRIPSRVAPMHSAFCKALWEALDPRRSAGASSVRRVGAVKSAGWGRGEEMGHSSSRSQRWHVWESSVRQDGQGYLHLTLAGQTCALAAGVVAFAGCQRHVLLKNYNRFPGGAKFSL